MKTDQLTSVDIFCTSHNIEIAFISSLEKTGLITITTIDDTKYIDSIQLLQLERIIRMYYELDINIEGIDTINHLLNRITSLQDEITMLRNKLRLYEMNE
jgi:hypothetical protein